MCVWRQACVCICAVLLNLSNDKPEVTATLNASCRCVFAGWCRRSAGTDRPLGPQGWTWWALLCRTLQWGRYITPFPSFSFTSPPCSPLNIFSFSTPLRHKQNITQHLSNIPPLWWQLRFKRHTDNDVMHLWICDTLPHTCSSSASSRGYWWQFLVFSFDNEIPFMLIHRFDKTVFKNAFAVLPFWYTCQLSKPWERKISLEICKIAQLFLFETSEKQIETFL